MSILNHVWLGQLLGGITNNAKLLIDKFGEEELYSARNFKEFSNYLSTAQRESLDRCTIKEAENILTICEKENIDIITISDFRYPQKLTELKNPPIVLYARGNTRLLSEGFKVAIVGTRTPSKYGSDATRLVAKALTDRHVTIVSGLAEGLDGIAHSTAIAEGTPTIAVLGNSVNVYYPSINREMQQTIEQSGLVISETAPGVRPYTNSFLIRNRIIAAVADAVIVTESRRKSGTMETAKNAVLLKRPLYAIPGNILSPLGEGTNVLIHRGATPIVNTETLIKDCGLAVKRKRSTKKVTEDISPLAAKILMAIPNDGVNTELLYSKLNEQEKVPIATPTILAAITELELFGYIERGVGGMLHRNN